jgi:hypothetical protein
MRATPGDPVTLLLAGAVVDVGRGIVKCKVAHSSNVVSRNRMAVSGRVRLSPVELQRKKRSLLPENKRSRGVGFSKVCGVNIEYVAEKFRFVMYFKNNYAKSAGRWNFLY